MSRRVAIFPPSRRRSTSGSSACARDVGIRACYPVDICDISVDLTLRKTAREINKPNVERAYRTVFRADSGHV